MEWKGLKQRKRITSIKNGREREFIKRVNKQQIELKEICCYLSYSRIETAYGDMNRLNLVSVGKYI